MYKLSRSIEEDDSVIIRIIVLCIDYITLDLASDIFRQHGHRINALIVSSKLY